MPDDSHSLIPHPRADLAVGKGHGGRILAEMVGEALGLTRNAASSNATIAPCFQIAEHLFCEPDYRQIMTWAQQLGFEPEKVVDCLFAKGPASWCGDTAYQTKIENGRITSLYLDGKALPINKLSWVDGLVIEVFGFYGPSQFQTDADQLPSIRLPRLRRLRLDKYKAETLQLSECPHLTELICTDCGLTKIDLSGLYSLTGLNCCGNQIAELNLSTTPRLTKLYCTENQLTGLKLDATPLLTALSCFENKIRELDLAKLPHLSVLFCDNNQIVSLDLSAAPMLHGLTCSGNRIRKLELSSCPKLTILFCSANQLTELDLSGVQYITDLRCDQNQLTTLNISSLANLKTLEYDQTKTELIQRLDQHF